MIGLCITLLYPTRHVLQLRPMPVFASQRGVHIPKNDTSVLIGP